MAEPVLTSWRCAGCGEETRQPWSCPNRDGGDDVDHVLERRLIVGRVDFVDTPGERNPFVRFRRLSQTYHLARIAGMSDEGYCALVRQLDSDVAAVCGRDRGFVVTPTTRIAGAHDVRGMWVKHDWQGVSGSHKARHLMGIGIYLRVAVALGARREVPRLAIASCGNAALAAAVIARALEYPLEVFIPEDARPSVVEQLRELKAEVTVCPRLPGGPPGDPCYHAFRRAVVEGALPFCVQGPDCGLTIEGGRTLGWEIAATLVETPVALRPQRVVLQIGGGAMAASVAAGIADFVAIGQLDGMPAIHAVQTRGGAPLVRAWERLVEASGDADKGGVVDTASVACAARARSKFMWPWEETPSSLAHGILDDETYDWLAVVGAMARTGGAPVLVDDELLRQAREIADAAAGAPISYTGAAGLAGALTFSEEVQRTTLVVLTGADRSRRSVDE